MMRKYISGRREESKVYRDGELRRIRRGIGGFEGESTNSGVGKEGESKAV